MSFIHPQLTKDCKRIGYFPLSHLLLVNDSNYPWFILVPDRDDIREIYQLNRIEQGQLMQESCQLAEVLMQVFNGDKLNIAALGNQVPQLHLHHIVRFESDPAWPAPVWGKVPAIPYSIKQTSQIMSSLRASALGSSKLVFLK